MSQKPVWSCISGHRGGWRVVPDQGRGQDHECNAERTSPDGVITGRGGALGQDLSARVAATFEFVFR